MKKLVFISIVSIFGCKKKDPVFLPVGNVANQSDLDVSKNRTKNLNLIERQQIEEWMKGQDQKFFPTPLNYWINVDGFNHRERRADNSSVSYAYDLYDFNQTKIYDQSVSRVDVKFGHFDELKAVENALRYMNKGEEVTLLVPSSLGYGTYGDQNKIDNDIPLIIKLKVL